jgi:hypothetical protein
VKVLLKKEKKDCDGKVEKMEIEIRKRNDI